MRLKDYERGLMLQGGDVDVTDSDLPPKPQSFAEEQAELKRAFKRGLMAATADSEEEDDDEGDIFTLRKKTEGEQEAEEEDFRKFLLAEEEREKSKAVDEMQTLRRYWTDPSLDESERFLRDYLLNKGWVDKDQTRRAPPSYEEVTKDDDVSSTNDASDDDEEELERQDDYERQHNFRFEEAGANTVMTYSRDLPSVRRADSRRAVQRASLKERKDAEKAERKKELERHKQLKQREILEKLQHIQELTGAPSLGFGEADLEADFDPDKFDQQMAATFDAEYYEEGEQERPVFAADEDAFIMGGDYEDDKQDEEEQEEKPRGGNDGRKKKKKKKDRAPQEEVEEFNMDADYHDDAQEEEASSSKKSKKRKHKDDGDADATLAAAQQAAAKGDATADRLLDEYYNLNYEDIVGDLPTRFKYKKVKPVSYGLSAVEILMADEADLNAHVSLKKLAPYREEGVQGSDERKVSKAKRVRKFREALRRKLQEDEEEDAIALLKEEVGDVYVEEPQQEEEQDKAAKSKKTHGKQVASKGKDAPAHHHKAGKHGKAR